VGKGVGYAAGWTHVQDLSNAPPAQYRWSIVLATGQKAQLDVLQTGGTNLYAYAFTAQPPGPAAHGC
jgi:hypothetical protein